MTGFGWEFVDTRGLGNRGLAPLGSLAWMDAFPRRLEATAPHQCGTCIGVSKKAPPRVGVVGGNCQPAFLAHRALWVDRPHPDVGMIRLRATSLD
jgi:hypothetical protein